MPGLTRTRRSSPNIWPGFVDALASLLMVIIFLLLIFTIFLIDQASSWMRQRIARTEAMT